ncbi:hypothetical protein C8Q72DRAFT_821412 [Fomitopsis betulina]|nr:hypothetical protein C8Q72DRAFT_821412 [Fomitopsis betulina]
MLSKGKAAFTCHIDVQMLCYVHMSRALEAKLGIIIYELQERYHVLRLSISSLSNTDVSTGCLTFLFPLHLVSAASTLYDTTPLPPHSIFRHRMRASAIITLAASTAILPSMCLPISGGSDLPSRREFNDLLAREIEEDMYPANNSTVEESGANENSTIAASGTHKNSTIEGSSVPLNSTVAGSGGLVLSMLAKDAFKVGKVIYRIGNTASNSYQLYKQRNQRRDLQEAGLWERAHAEDELYERGFPEEDIWARDLSKGELLERAVQEGSSRHYIRSGGSNSNNPQKHRRSEFDGLFARDYEYTYQWE